MIEITAETESPDPFVVSVEGNQAALGFKRFKGVGQFKYDWVLDYLDADDVTGLIKALQFAHAMMETE